MNNTVKHIGLFILLVLLQVLIFNNVNLFGYINPYIYILFVIYYPLKKEKGLFLIVSFLLGLMIDIFSDSGGVNAAATLFIAYIRLPVLSAILGKTDFDYVLFNLRSIAFSKALIYISILSFIHHFIIFLLSYFSFSTIVDVFIKTILTSVFSIVLIVTSIVIFTKKR